MAYKAIKSKSIATIINPLAQSASPPSYRRLGLSIPSGRMRSSIDFWVSAASPTYQSDTGSLLPAEWSKMATVRAYARRVTGTEFFQMLQFGHRVDSRFILRWFKFNVGPVGDSVETTPTDAMRIVWNDDMYRIIRVEDIDDLHIELNIDGVYISKATDVV